MIVGIIPAHNEAAGITLAVESLAPQVDHVIVISDNSTDDTIKIAEEAGAQVLESVANSDKKAGALNQVLSGLLGIGDSPFDLEALTDSDFVLVMDADSQIDAGFVSRALTEFDIISGSGAVGGIFMGDPGGGLIAQLQRNEYVRYAREVSRRGANAWVLSGTASVLRVDVLRDVSSARVDGRLPGGREQVYDTLALTEDNELTLAIKTLGYSTMSPKECIVRTEVMLTWPDLWRQRVRWQRGALENLRNYRLNRTTLPYFGQQSLMVVGVFAMWLFVILTALSITTGNFHIQVVWLFVGLIFWLERMVTVWRGGWAARLVAFPLLIEFGYDLFLQAVIIKSFYDMFRGSTPEWHHATDAET